MSRMLRAVWDSLVEPHAGRADARPLWIMDERL
jgi:hypothetical protein